MLLVAAGLLIAVALVHSILGERRLIGPLLRLETLPVIRGSLTYTRRTLRLAWHVTSLMWAGLAAVLVAVQLVPDQALDIFLWCVAAMFGASGVVSLVAARGKHISWIFFLLIAACVAAAGAPRAQDTTSSWIKLDANGASRNVVLRKP
jgi:hypothetical protein